MVRVFMYQGQMRTNNFICNEHQANANDGDVVCGAYTHPVEKSIFKTGWVSSAHSGSVVSGAQTK